MMIGRRRFYYQWLNWFVGIWVMILNLTSQAYCLKDLKIFVPDAIILGNAATMSCQYDLEQVKFSPPIVLCHSFNIFGVFVSLHAVLYSVRWYFGAEEFYRYVAKETPPGVVFPVADINVDLLNSDATSVTLKGVTSDLTGSYQCEVSEDAPLFHTDIRAAHMQVIIPPKDDPILQVDKKIISASDNLKAVCTIGSSYPAANISWYINGRKLYKTPYQRITQYTDEGTDTYSSIEIHPYSQLLQNFFQSIHQYQSSIQLLCEVSILEVFQKNVQQQILLSIGPTTTGSPNLLSLESFKRMNYDPDNLALAASPASVSVPTITQILVCWVCHLLAASGRSITRIVSEFSKTHHILHHRLWT